MKITYDPPSLAEELEAVLRDLIAENADQMGAARCERHDVAPAELRVSRGTAGNLVDIEVIGCCDEYAVEDED